VKAQRGPQRARRGFGVSHDSSGGMGEGPEGQELVEGHGVMQGRFPGQDTAQDATGSQKV
jgi:hypothetical protein